MNLQGMIGKTVKISDWFLLGAAPAVFRVDAEIQVAFHLSNA